MFSKYDLHEAMNYRPGETPWVKPPTPQEMRVGIARASYYSTILRQINNVAEREGWSGEDKYTALAFYTTLQLEVYQIRELRRIELEPMPPFIVKSKNLKTIDGHPTACDPPMTATEVLSRQKGPPFA